MYVKQWQLSSIDWSNSTAIFPFFCRSHTVDTAILLLRRSSFWNMKFSMNPRIILSCLLAVSVSVFWFQSRPITVGYERRTIAFEIDGHRISSFEDPCYAFNEVADLMTDVLWGNATCAVTKTSPTKSLVSWTTFRGNRRAHSSKIFPSRSTSASARAMIRVMHDTRPWAGTGVGCMHPDPCNALQRFKKSTNRVLDPDYNSRNSSSVGETCSDYCNDSCSYYCSDNDSSSATAISPRISASWVIMPAILAAIALAALS